MKKKNSNEYSIVDECNFPLKKKKKTLTDCNFVIYNNF